MLSLRFKGIILKLLWNNFPKSWPVQVGKCCCTCCPLLAGSISWKQQSRAPFQGIPDIKPMIVILLSLSLFHSGDVRTASEKQWWVKPLGPLDKSRWLTRTTDTLRHHPALSALALLELVLDGAEKPTLFSLPLNSHGIPFNSKDLECMIIQTGIL